MLQLQLQSNIHCRTSQHWQRRSHEFRGVSKWVSIRNTGTVWFLFDQNVHVFLQIRDHEADDFCILAGAIQLTLYGLSKARVPRPGAACLSGTAAGNCWIAPKQPSSYDRGGSSITEWVQTFIMTNLFEHGSQSNLINLALKTNGTKLNSVRIINVYHCTWQRFGLSSCFTPYGEFCSGTKDIYIGRGQYLVWNFYIIKSRVLAVKRL